MGGVGGEGDVGSTPVGEIKPKSHLMLIKDSEACLTHIFFPLPLLYAGHLFFSDLLYIPCFIIFDLNKKELESESHLQMSKSLSAHLLVPNGKTAEMNGASSADQVLLWGVSLLHSLIIVGSCLLMTQSGSTENHYPGCVMEIGNALCEGGSSKHRFVLKRGREMRLRPSPSGVSQNVCCETEGGKKKNKTRDISPTENHEKKKKKKLNKNKCNTSSHRTAY